MLSLDAGIDGAGAGAPASMGEAAGEVMAVGDPAGEVAGWMAAALAAEIGTGNDQLTPQVWHHGLHRACVPGELIARVETVGRAIGVVIESAVPGPLGVPPSLRRLVNPAVSVPVGPGFERLVLVPVSLARIAGLAGATLVWVPAWAREQVFHPGRGAGELYGEDFQRRDAWRTVAPNLLLFSSLLARRRLALVSTHDLVAHVAGLDAAHWTSLQPLAARVERCLRAYLARVARPSVETLVLPFLLGVLLDVHAQPTSRHLARQNLALADTLIDYLDARGAHLAAMATPHLATFPRAYAPLMNLLSSADDHATLRRHAIALLDAIADQTTTR